MATISLHPRALRSCCFGFQGGRPQHGVRFTVGVTTITKPVCRGLVVRCIGWDPEGILGPPQPGHISRRTFQKKLEEDKDYRETLRREAQQKLEKQRAARAARVVPDTDKLLVEYFLDTDAEEIEYEVARCKLRLTSSFFSHLENEIGSLRFSLNKTKEVEDRLIELEALQKVLHEGIEAYDKMTCDFVEARSRLTRIFESKDKKTTLLEMVEKNELDRPLLAVLDQNITTANAAGEVQAAAFMEKIRGAVIKYITL